MADDSSSPGFDILSLMLGTGPADAPSGTTTPPNPQPPGAAPTDAAAAGRSNPTSAIPSPTSPDGHRSATQGQAEMDDLHHLLHYQIDPPPPDPSGASGPSASEQSDQHQASAGAGAGAAGSADGAAADGTATGGDDDMMIDGAPEQAPDVRDYSALIRQLTFENVDPIDILAQRAREAPPGNAGDKARTIWGTVWLANNYEPCDGFNIPRQDLYEMYKKFCELNSVVPMNAAFFGKIVRLLWPELKTRRLGTRGQSKYHYCGIRIKGAQYTAAQLNQVQHPFAALVMSGLGNLTLNPMFGDANNVTSIPLTDFPTITDSFIPLGASPDLVSHFLNAYKLHCQSVLDTLQLLQFPQVEILLRGFWTALPDESRRLVNSPEVTELIWRCDSILYDTIMNLESWILASMEGYYPMLVARKVEVAKVFAQQLKRHTSLNFLAQAAVQVLESAENMHTMFIEWSKLDFEGIKDQAAWVTECRKVDVMQIAEMEVKNLLTGSTKLEQWTKLEPARYIQQARQFILKWSFYGSLVMRDLTLRSMSTFGSFHILRLFIDEYIFFVVEQRIANVQSLATTGPPPATPSAQHTQQQQQRSASPPRQSNPHHRQPHHLHHPPPPSSPTAAQPPAPNSSITRSASPGSQAATDLIFAALAGGSQAPQGGFTSASTAQSTGAAPPSSSGTSLSPMTGPRLHQSPPQSQRDMLAGFAGMQVDSSRQAQQQQQQADVDMGDLSSGETGSRAAGESGGGAESTPGGIQDDEMQED
ncbi:RFX DNA-binding domain-domain-containing protein [Catenaria anguillulae PL171]|uniref:RFX DNA-binding domain-domain-containing protein n=1 Tax=Catenaria anguillulae PL171 TaxID=765915 RepID=A0A1Y2I544_9FUNG|nr:RFX DNA-binding domain-domain-containing protein [Catenaria anguillulae PL171]